MRLVALPSRTAARKPIPRGLALSGPPILSYGFRPFFFAAGVYAITAMVLWVGALSGLWSIGGTAGPVLWHAHEMLFGYAAAALGGFILTAVPNWTGGLPVSGRPLALLVGLWLAGRLVSIAPGLVGESASAAIDALFLPSLALVVAREVIVGRNWQNLRVAVGISLLGALNLLFHVLVLLDGDPEIVVRATVALYVLLVCQMGGRIIPSFTRNYLARKGSSCLPAPADRFDQIALAGALIGGVAWVFFPDGWPTAVLCTIAAALHALRLVRWRGLDTWQEPLLLVLHVAYCFVPVGYGTIALSAVGLVSTTSALHLLTVGVIGLTTLAVMTRASRGHTGRPLKASPTTSAAYLCIVLAALSRPLAETFIDFYHPILMLAGVAWVAGFSLFVIEHAPMHWARSLPKKG